MTDNIAEKLKKLPDSPGVYLMKDAAGKIIYVGKAIVLKNRVRQYFQSGKNHTPKVRVMVEKIADFETIMTGSEVEALILESNLIKKHRPRYNISLKDDKSYPYVKVTLQEDYPRVFITRRLLKDGAKYFGPYTNVTALHESLKLLRRLFPLRTCKTMGDRPCLEYHIKRCLAPCVGKADKDEYRDMVQEVTLFLEGRADRVAKELNRRMEEAAENFRFELAARLRDQLQAVQKVTEKQKIVTEAGDMDAVGLARSPYGVCVQIFFVRGGKMVGRERFIMNGSEEEKDEDILAAFLQQYYYRATFIPKEILLPVDVQIKDTDLLLIDVWLTEKRGGAVDIHAPQRGTKRDIVKMAEENAQKYLQDEADRLQKAQKATLGAVADLGRYLGLATPPNRMECFDISHNQGQETVASMVVFEGGEPKKSDYRRYKIKSAEGKPDDFKSMREVTQRRYGKLTAAELPDLIVIDGGLGQLSSALSIIRGLGHKEVAVVGLAKQFELIFVEGSSEPIELPRHSPALYLIQRIRDEAHRFAITYHRSLRRKRNLVSVLDHIEGIGEKRRQGLWSHFGKLDKIKAATIEELAAAPNMNLPAAKAVYNFFQARQDFGGK
ncbi:MAG: excinuclease ABC subunit UvrC [Selenomonadaceae bacterium]|nr:excinuclease ABC subunit UvrC [Selenomonadaceae bacterium]